MCGIQPLNMEVLSKLMRYCTYRERSKKEVQQKLDSLGILSENYHLYLDYLTNNNYLDYNRFATAFVLGKFRINKWGRQKIKQALYVKEVDSVLIENALSKISNEDYFKTLKKLATVKLNGINTKNEFELRSKTARYLLSKGYESDLIKQVLEQLINNT